MKKIVGNILITVGMGNFRRLAFAILLAALLVSCGTGGGNDATGAAAVAELENEGEPVLVLRPDGIFDVDDVAAAGWKKSKELSHETLPEATGVWYGFYNQRDVEVRIYESHDSAISAGKGPADDATGRGKPSGTTFGSGSLFNTRMSYTTYAIIGNMILLCEVKIEDCQGLLDGIE